MADKIDTGHISKFDGSNYNQWRFQIQCVLRAKGVFAIVDGTEAKPAAAGNEQSAWIKNDAAAMFIMTPAMDFSQITLIENCSSSKDMLVKLDSIYMQRSESNKMIAHEKFHQYKMKENEKMAQHIANVENLAKRLREMGENISDAAIMTKIIGTLPPKFRNFRQAWLSMSDDRQTILNLTSRLIDEESNLTATEQVESALASTHSFRKYNFRGWTRGRGGHHETQRNQRYHPHQQRKQESNISIEKSQEKSTAKICYCCRKRGHIARDCWFKEEQSDNQASENSSKDHGEFSALNAVISMKNNDASNFWTMDSGASAHMTHHLDFFSKLSKVEDTTVLLGNNESLHVQGIGDVKIKKLINNSWYESTIKDVLYVPDLKRNLFSEGVITKKGWTIIKKGTVAEIYDGDELIASAVQENNKL